jgi:hypothetical protein
MASTKPKALDSALLGVSFQRCPYNYGGGNIIAGEQALVVAVTSTAVTVLTHNLYTAQLLELAHVDFWRQFLPRLDQSRHQTAAQLRNNFKVLLKSTSQQLKLLEDILKTRLEVPKMSSPKGYPKARPCADHQRRTCIELFREKGQVHHIPLSASDGLVVAVISEAVFDERYKPMPDYPVDKAARLYVEFSQHLGATAEAMDALGKMCKMLNSERELAIAAVENRKKYEASPVAKTSAKRRSPTKDTSTPWEDTDTHDDANEAGVKLVNRASINKMSAKATQLMGESDHIHRPKKPKKEVRPLKNPGVFNDSSAAGMFQKLIMEGQLTDDQIFERVQLKFNLSNKKRSYVRWYRNYLTKQGLNPPEPK